MVQLSLKPTVAPGLDASLNQWQTPIVIDFLGVAPSNPVNPSLLCVTCGRSVRLAFGRFDGRTLPTPHFSRLGLGIAGPCASLMWAPSTTLGIERLTPLQSMGL